MTKYIYTKAKRRNFRKFFRLSGLLIALFGILFGLYTFYPLISWQIYISPIFTSDNFASPIPQTTILTRDTIKSLLENSIHQGSWLPSYNQSQVTAGISSYALSVPKLKIKDAYVSTIDTYINDHLVQFPGTSTPPSKGNAVVFGHSTLPQLFDPKNYKTIFANAQNLKIDDTFQVTLNNTTYVYRIFNISIVDAEDTSYLAQAQDDSYLTLVTCTPPGTTWKRLVIKSRIEKI